MWSGVRETSSDTADRIQTHGPWDATDPISPSLLFSFHLWFRFSMCSDQHNCLHGHESLAAVRDMYLLIGGCDVFFFHFRFRSSWFPTNCCPPCSLCLWCVTTSSSSSHWRCAVTRRFDYHVIRTSHLVLYPLHTMLYSDLTHLLCYL